MAHTSGSARSILSNALLAASNWRRVVYFNQPESGCYSGVSQYPSRTHLGSNSLASSFASANASGYEPTLAPALRLAESRVSATAYSTARVTVLVTMAATSGGRLYAGDGATRTDTMAEYAALVIGKAEVRRRTSIRVVALR